MKTLPMISDSSDSPNNHNTDIGAEIHIFKSDTGLHAFITNGSRIYDVERADDYCKEGQNEKLNILNDTDLEGIVTLTKRKKYIGSEPIYLPPLYSISLNVAQTCNMTCGYCYADMGKFKQCTYDAL